MIDRATFLRRLALGLVTTAGGVDLLELIELPARRFWPSTALGPAWMAPIDGSGVELLPRMVATRDGNGGVTARWAVHDWLAADCLRVYTPERGVRDVPFMVPDCFWLQSASGKYPDAPVYYNTFSVHIDGGAWRS